LTRAASKFNFEQAVYTRVLPGRSSNACQDHSEMKQLELINKRAKPKFCNWIVFSTGQVRVCGDKAIVTIHDGAYCPAHAEKAAKMFGQGKPIYA